MLLQKLKRSHPQKNPNNTVIPEIAKSTATHTHTNKQLTKSHQPDQGIVHNPNLTENFKQTANNMHSQSMVDWNISESYTKPS